MGDDGLGPIVGGREAEDGRGTGRVRGCLPYESRAAAESQGGPPSESRVGAERVGVRRPSREPQPGASGYRHYKSAAGVARL